MHVFPFIFDMFHNKPIFFEARFWKPKTHSFDACFKIEQISSIFFVTDLLSDISKMLPPPFAFSFQFFVGFELFWKPFPKDFKLSYFLRTKISSKPYHLSLTRFNFYWKSEKCKTVSFFPAQCLDKNTLKNHKKQQTFNQRLLAC